MNIKLIYILLLHVYIYIYLHIFLRIHLYVIYTNVGTHIPIHLCAYIAVLSEIFEPQAPWIGLNDDKSWSLI